MAEHGGAKRRLAAVLSADVVGYSRLMAEDDRATLETLKRDRAAIGRIVEAHDGRVVNTPGDALLAELPSAFEALAAALEIQDVVEARNQALAAMRRMHWRIGLAVGDVLVEPDGTLYGDGVNIAARMEALAEAGGICLSSTAHDHLKGRVDAGFEDLGPQAVKNFAEPIRAFRVLPGRAINVARHVRAGRRAVRLGWIAAAAAILVAVAGVVSWQAMRPPAPEGAETSATPVPPGTEPAADKPSIAVLPFDNLSGDTSQDYLVDGLTEEIITGLARVPALSVVARNSTSIYRGKPVDVRQVGRDLGAGYVLEGSVRKAGDRVRIAAQLNDAATGDHVWAERYDRPLTDIFALEDDITREIVAALQVEIGQEKALAAPERVPNVEAHDLLLRGRAYLRDAGRDSTVLARKMLERAVELDADLAEAHADLSLLYLRDWFFGWSGDELLRDRSVESAQTAVALDPASSVAHTRLAWALAWTRRWDEAVEAGRRAVELDSHSTDALIMLARALDFAGESDDALTTAEQAVRLDPEYFLGHHTVGAVQFSRSSYNAAEVALKASVARNPNFPPSHLFLIGTYFHTDRLDQARAELAQTLRLMPGLTESALRERLPYRNTDRSDRLIEAVVKAGLLVGEPRE